MEYRLHFMILNFDTDRTAISGYLLYAGTLLPLYLKCSKVCENLSVKVENVKTF